MPERSWVLKDEYWIDFCSQVFNLKNYTGPSVNETNKYYGGLNITGSNIFFMTASEDPWQHAGMRSIHDPSLQKDMRAYHIECQDCGHCIDLHADKTSDPKSLTEGRA